MAHLKHQMAQCASPSEAEETIRLPRQVELMQPDKPASAKDLHLGLGVQKVE